ncbi:MAG: Acyl-CoA dehydrogenase [Conexibacter sp.]|nr:Acyl-CoA dehydrogenase [Conexibacter sp.]
MLSSYSDADERDGRLAQEVVATLRDEGFFGLWVARSLGGHELDAVQGLAVLEELSRADAATGWVVMATAVSITAAAAYLEDDACSELFAGDGIPVIAGQGAPNGTAVRRDGGYELSGRWSYGSGIKHADWVHTGALVRDGGGPPQARIFLVPRDQVALGGNWDVLGLSATGSVDYAVDGAFVPDRFTHGVLDVTPLRGGTVPALGLHGIQQIVHAAWALGVMRRMLDELAEHARRGSGPAALSAGDGFREGFGRAEAKVRAARALVYETWERNQATLDAGEPLSTRQRTLGWLALNHATWTGSEVCVWAYTTAGGVSLRSGPLQRLFREMHAGTQHISSSPALLRECGRDLAGLADGRVWRRFALSEPTA